MKRRNFFKKIAGAIAGLVVAPFVIKAKESEYEKAVREESDKLAAKMNEIFPHKDNLNWVEIHKQIVENPNYVPESKEQFEQRKSIYRPITEKIVNRLCKPAN